MNILGYNLSLTKKKDNNPNFVNDLIAKYPSAYLGNNIGNLGQYVVDTATPFKLIKNNVITSSALRLLSNKVGTYGFELLDEKGEVVNDKKMYSKASSMFSYPTLHQFVYKYLETTIGAGQAFLTPSEMNGLGEVADTGHVKVLDPRRMTISVDNYGNPTSYNYRGKESFNSSFLIDHLIFPDIDRPAYGLSMLSSVIIDGLTDLATSDKLYHFFRNNAMPNVIYMMKDGVITTEAQKEEFERKINERHNGVSNTSKPMASSAISDVKVLELNHRDLELLKQRLFIHNEFGIVFGFDLRLLSYMRDGGSYSEIDSITLKQANSQIKVYARIIEDGMKLAYDKFVEKTPYYFHLLNEYYKDENKDKSLGLQEIDRGAISRNEYRTRFGMETVSDKTMDQYVQTTNTTKTASV